ncbi:MAG TPA: hypothetical protein VM008_15565 [Phycisphaerae bacterium]|nr:hypothetical protein [Phycisphaerae bacterium]
MTEATAEPITHSSPETFWDVFLRRVRYTGAVAISGFLFWIIGWQLVAPPPEMGGISLIFWTNSSGLFVALGLVLLIMAVTAISTLLVHPDSPHMGMFCALLGLAALSIRGGDSHMLMEIAQAGGAAKYANCLLALAVECVQWAILFLIAEMFARTLHDRFFTNIHWLTRSGPGHSTEALHKFAADRSALGVSLAVSQALKTTTLRRRIATPLAMIGTGILAYILLYVLLQSPLKGQVFFACFVAFFGSSALTYLAFPRVPAMAFCLAVPLTAAVAYFLGRNDPGQFPGYGGAFVTCALPIDFVATGIPGAILGYYTAIQWSLHSHDSAV